jgi:hypothetical protein
VRRCGAIPLEGIAPMKKPNLSNFGSSIKSNLSAQKADKPSATPLRCFTGSITAGTFSLLAYRLTISIATNFANRPVTSLNPAVVNISSAVRTLVIGMAALGVQLLFKDGLFKKSQDGQDTHAKTAIEPSDTRE